MNTMTHTATSPYQSLEVAISETGLVHAANGALLGDVDGMTRLGWDFAELETRPRIAPATFERVAREILRANGAGRNPHPALIADTIRELEHAYDTTGLIPTAHRGEIDREACTWSCSCGKGSKSPAASRYVAGNGLAKHVDAARRTERQLAEAELELEASAR
jgi:hypothetical protein